MASTPKKAKDELEKQKAILKVMESQETILGSLIKAFQGQEDSVASGKGNLQMIKKTLHFLLNFLQISTIFASFSRAHTGTLQNHSISPCTTTVRNNTVESSTIFHSNLMLRINWFYEI
jgi:hypothetical protein